MALYRVATLAGALWMMAACAAAPPPTVTMPAATAPALDFALVAPADLPTSTFTDERLREAEHLYQVYCAHCHGYDGEGQVIGAPGETERLGMKPVPAHDSTGDSWRYADPLLVAVIKYGIENPLNHYPMIAHGHVLSDAQIEALVDYMKLWWTEEQRAHQAEVTRNYTEARREAGITIDDPAGE